MTDYTANTTLAAAADGLRRSARVFITTHAKPDGDAYGSVVAMASALEQMGKQVQAVFMPPLPGCFRELLGTELYRVGMKEGTLERFDPDLVLVLDTGAWAQVSPLAEVLRPRIARMLIVDHHLSGDMPAPQRYIDGQAAACCELVAQLLDELGAEPDASPLGGTQRRCDPNPLFTPTVCQALFVGIASDTGWFRFSNTRPYTHELAARLQRAGVDHAELYRQLEQTERREKLALLTRALDSLELFADGAAALMTLRAEDFTETGAMLEETERIIDVPQIVSGVQVVALVTEPPPPPERPPASTDDRGKGNGKDPAAIRLSFRSKPGPGAVDVAKLASQFGGGGHARAAGAKIRGSLREVRNKVAAALRNLPR
ncbi:MAG: DHH family phosphoesterase [Phycisphaeraceae bacterium]